MPMRLRSTTARARCLRSYLQWLEAERGAQRVCLRDLVGGVDLCVRVRVSVCVCTHASVRQWENVRAHSLCV